MTFSKDVLDIFHQSQDEWYEKMNIKLDDDEFLTFLINTTKVNRNKECMKYNCKDCDFESNVWEDALKHAFENIGHTVGTPNDKKLNTIDNPIYNPI